MQRSSRLAVFLSFGALRALPMINNLIQFPFLCPVFQTVLLTAEQTILLIYPKKKMFAPCIIFY